MSAPGSRHPALVFDLDGTLVDSLPGITKSLNTALASISRGPLASDAVKRMVGEGVRRLVEQALDATGGRTGIDLEDVIARWNNAYRADGPTGTHVYPGVIETLELLRRAGTRMGLCTNKPKDGTATLLTAIGLSPFFAAVVTPDDAGARKPDGRHVLATVAALGADPAEAIYIGDSDVDVAAARNAGLPIILVSYGFARVPIETLEAAAVIDDFGDLPQALAALTAPQG